jgi:hypothetical protein
MPHPSPAPIDLPERRRDDRHHDHVTLAELVADADAHFLGSDDHALLRVADVPRCLAYLGLGAEHPLEALLGMTAPTGWDALGARCNGRCVPMATATVESGEYTQVSGAEPTPVAITFLVDRNGEGAGLLRCGNATTQLNTAPEGVVGDACRRALDLATAPPPASSRELWLRLWLDRVVDAAADGDDVVVGSWEAAVALHPSAHLSSDHVDAAPWSSELPDPTTLAEATHALTTAWPWSRLRRDAETVGTPGPALSTDLAAWMDDGMFARWLLADLAPLPLLLETAQRLLPWSLVADIDEVVLATTTLDQASDP